MKLSEMQIEIVQAIDCVYTKVKKISLHKTSRMEDEAT